MNNVNVLFLNNKAMRKLGATDMEKVMNDVENAYTLNFQGDVISPGKCVMRWGKTTEDENTLGRSAPT